MEEKLNPININHKEEPEKLIPKAVVRRAMESFDTYEASAARTYYYEHYASEREKKKMRLEDRTYLILSASFWIGVLMLFLVSVFGLIEEYSPAFLDWWWSL